MTKKGDQQHKFIYPVLQEKGLKVKSFLVRLFRGGGCSNQKQKYHFFFILNDLHRQ